MKKIFAAFTILCSLLLIGCEKRDPNQGKLVPQGTQIEFQLWTAQEGDFVEAMLREFVSSSRSSGVITKVIRFDNDEELQGFLTEKMAEGAGPDVILTESTWITQNPKKVFPLKDDPEFNAAAFDNTFMKAASELLLKDNAILGVPIAVDSLGIIYNEEHLVDRLENRNSPAPTWNEFKADMEKLTQEDNSFERFKYSGAAIGRIDNITHGFDILENLMVQMGTKFFTPDGITAIFATEKALSPAGQRIKAGVEALKLFTSFSDKRYKNYTWNEYITRPQDKDRDFNAFARGKTSMVFGYARDLAKIEEIIAQTQNAISNDVVRTAALPQITASGDKEAVAKVYSFAVPRTAENADISWRFLKHTAGKDVQNSFFGNTGLPSARLDLVSEQSQTPNLDIFVRQAKFARAQLFPLSKKEFIQAMMLITEKLHSGRSSAEVLLEAFEKQLNVELKSHWKREREIENNIKKNQQESQLEA